MNTGDMYPIRPMGRHSGGMSTRDWQQLASAYDTWNDHLAVVDEIDEDLRAFVKGTFNGYGLWDDINDEPMLGQYRLMFMHRC